MVDPLTVKITYDTPWVTLLDALRRTPIWSPTAAEKFGLANFSKNLVGAGPFTLGEWVPERPHRLQEVGGLRRLEPGCRRTRGRSMSTR